MLILKLMDSSIDLMSSVAKKINVKVIPVLINLTFISF